MSELIPERALNTTENIPFVRLLFSTLRQNLTTAFGETLTAFILKRAIMLSIYTCPALEKITITRQGPDYCYCIPREIESDAQTICNLNVLVDNVIFLLREMSGNLLLPHLLSNPLIRKFAE